MNNSSNLSSREDTIKKDSFSFNEKSSPFVDLNLTYDQYFMLQNYLPKRYNLLELKPTAGRRGPPTNLMKILTPNEGIKK